MNFGYEAIKAIIILNNKLFLNDDQKQIIIDIEEISDE